MGRKPVPLDQPPREVCIQGEEAPCFCYDPRLEEGKQSYVKPNCKNYISTNPTDYNAHEEWISKNCFGRPKSEQGFEHF